MVWFVFVKYTSTGQNYKKSSNYIRVTLGTPFEGHLIRLLFLLFISNLDNIFKYLFDIFSVLRWFEVVLFN